MGVMWIEINMVVSLQILKEREDLVSLAPVCFNSK